MRSALPFLLILVAGCGGPVPYYDDESYRRAALLASLWSPDNGYSRLRIAEYATGHAGWDALPEWNPTVAPVPFPAQGPGPQPRPLSWDDAVAQGDPAALRALGEQAFFRYPVQIAWAVSPALSSPDAARSFGFWTDPIRGTGGVVRVTVADGATIFAYTCATCHAAERTGTLLIGDGNDRLDLGRLGGQGDAALGWGPGRLDVSSTRGDEPVRIPDLRPVRLLSHLHHDATVAQRDLISLAIRLETLIITAHGGTLRPPRQVALALATFVWSLADTLPDPAPRTDADRRGADLLLTRCAGCHAPPGFTGAPVPLSVAGTDPFLGRSPERGTGTYRVPSLRGVGTRGLLLHDAALTSPGTLFDPARLRDDYQGGTRPGPVPGHDFGLDLPASDRADLVHYLQTL